MSISQLDIQNVCFRMQSWMSISELDIQDVVFECRAECWTHSSIFKVCFILNAELNVKLTARYSRCMFSNAELNVELTARYPRCMFSNAELNVEPIARYSKCVLFWMQIWMLNSQLDIQNVCFRMQSWCRTHSSIFKLCIILNAELNVDLTARYSKCMFSNAELNVDLRARYSRCSFRMQSWMLNL